MAALQWSQELELNQPAMDATHKEFVELLNRVEAADEKVLLDLWQELIAHTEGHFGQEDQWMQSTGFSAENCHSTQHRVVLEIMREVSKKAADGDYSMIRGMMPELASWFSYHAQTMDAALAQHMQSLGFDTQTGEVGTGASLPEALISGCGGACSMPGDHERHAAQAEQVAQAAA